MAMVKTEYSIMDELDEKQIVGFSDELKKAMAYKTQGKMELTFIGLKAITLKMSQKGQPLETIASEINLEKDDPTNQKLWFWRARVKVRNQKTEFETEGISECPYYDTQGNYDQFGRTKAHSKAERNAWRKQIPELELTTFLNSLNKDQLKDVSELPKANRACKCGPNFEAVSPDSRICKNCGGKKI
jgi:hypothetical protein